MDEESDPILAKPDELLALREVAERIFARFRSWFEVPATVQIDLAEVDSAVSELGDPEMIAAMAMRKLQALHLIATPGIRTSTDVVIAIVNDLDRAMLQAPSMYLERKARRTDWDQALAELGTSDEDDLGVPVAPDDVDPEIEEFQVDHASLHEAVHAVVEAAQGEIRYFE